MKMNEQEFFVASEKMAELSKKLEGLIPIVEKIRKGYESDVAPVNKTSKFLFRIALLICVVNIVNLIITIAIRL